MFLGVLLAGLFPAAVLARLPEVPRVAPGEVLVVGSPETFSGTAPAAGNRPGSPVPSPAEQAFRRLARGAGVTLRGVHRLGAGRSFAAAFPGGAWVFRYEGNEPPDRVAARLGRADGVRYAGVNHLLSLAGAGRTGAGKSGPGAPTRNAARSPSVSREDAPDPLFEEQYALAAVRARQAWEHTRGAGVLVAVIDTGVELTHPDLADRIAINAAERDGQDGVDDDGNGYVDDVFGYDFTDAPGVPGAGDYLGRDRDPSDDQGHGTEVAGVLAATRNNGIGIAGVAPEAKILAVRAGFRTGLPLVPGLLEEDDAAAAILYAVDRGARILNLSWGDFVDAPLVRAAIRFARARGVLVVAAAGNTPEDRAFYPASEPGVFAAGASDAAGERAAFSTYGQDLDLLAPGSALWTTALAGTYAQCSGTSFSAPMTAGVAALVWSVFPEWAAEQVAARLRLSASAAFRGWSASRGWGILDAAEAVSEAAPGEPPPVAEVEAVRGQVAAPSTAEFAAATTQAAPPPAEASSPGETSRERTLVGTVAAAGLSHWTLGVLPEQAARAAEEASALETLPGEILLAERVDRQAVAESLAAFAPAPADTGLWVVRLRAWVDGYPAIEKRTRFRLPPLQVDLDSLRVEWQVGRVRGDAPDSAGGWDLVATWHSRAAYAGALLWDGATAWPRRVEERTEGTRHALRLRGPLPVGTHSVEVWGRPEGAPAFLRLAAREVEVPSPRLLFGAEAVPEPPPGTPMARSADWDGDGRPDLFVESPPGEEPYGVVRRYEVDGWAPSASPIEAGSSEGLYTGIPVDATTGPDGRILLAVYRTDGWSVWESSEPAGFPDRRVFSVSAPEDVPVRFLSDGEVLVAVSAEGLTLYERDAAAGFRVASQASVPGSMPTAPGVIVECGDGSAAVFFADRNGGLVRFAVSGRTARGAGRFPLDGVQIVALAGATAGSGPAPGRPGDEPDFPILLTAEVDPPFPEAEGDLERAAVRVKRWVVHPDGLTPNGELALAGMFPSHQVRLVEWEGTPLLFRGTELDLLDASGDGLRWGGALPRGEEPARVDGAVVVRLEGSGRGLLWSGTAAEGTPGTRIALTRLGVETPPTMGAAPPLRVIAARVARDSLEVTLAWDDAGCGLPERVERTGPGEARRNLSVQGRTAWDAIPLGASVSYRLHAPGCPDRVAEVRGETPQAVIPAWTEQGDLAVELNEPLTHGPERVLLRRGDDLTAPQATFVDREGGRILLVLAERVSPDSLIVEGAWDALGLPLGGSVRVVVAVPARPKRNAWPVLARVTYEGEPTPPHLLVSLGGGALPDSCARPFFLEPRGWALEPGRETTGGERILVLPAALSPGRYRLRLDAACLGAAETAPGLTRVFSVGADVYPNPVPPGRELVVAGAARGSRARILDVSGRERMAWRTAESPDRHRVDGLAPGLYFLRVEEPNGRVALLRKLVILR